jgi:hypothetical protein
MASWFPDLRAAATFVACFAAAGASLDVCAQPASPQKELPISEAEQRLFLDAHLTNLPDKAAVTYDYAKTGTLEPAVEDRVSLKVENTAKGRHTHVDYLSGKDALVLPDIDEANGNPVILSFLERDVREMERRTGGKSNYFRKRVRLALAESAKVETVTMDFQGKPVEAVRISIRPYENDPMQARFRAFTGKVYLFTLSKQVPGMVYEMRTEVRDPHAPAQAPPLVIERLVYAGTKP